MQLEANKRNGPASTLTSATEPSEPGEEQDFEDSLLQAVAEPPSPLRLPAPGTRLGGPSGDRFEILEKLGGGAMGCVFRAWDEALQRTVALKFLMPRGKLPGGLVSSLLQQEARAAAHLDHEHIVRIFDVAEWDTPSWAPRVPFLVMEYLEGEPLAVLLRRGRLNVRRALELLEGITAGLAHAHARHVIHRDLKPRNIFLTNEGRVKLLDFGLAHVIPTPTASTLPHLPMAGSPPYMAPEQWRGAPQDARTDVWAIGVLLHEMLTGEPLYRAESAEEVREKVVAPEPVPWVIERLPDLPEGVAALLAKALAKAPEARFPTAVELHQQVCQLLEQLGPASSKPATAPQRRQVSLVACQLGSAGGDLDELEAEDAGELQAAFHRLFSEILLTHGGSVASCLGNQGLACFGYPRAHEDDSEQAVHTALSLAETLPGALHKALPHLPRSRFEVRVGVHSGAVVVDRAFSDSQPGGVLTIQGEAPSMAAELARQADAGAVLLSDTTWTLVRGAFKAEALPLPTHSGTANESHGVVHRLLGPLQVPLRFARVLHAGGLSPLVGREQELRALTERWEQAMRGEGGCVLLLGEAGLGKSRLIQELCGRVPTEVAAVARSQCWPQLRNSAFHPIIELLRTLLHLGPQPHEASLREQLGALGLEPEAAGLLAQLLCPSTSTLLLLPRLEPAQQQAWRAKLGAALISLAQKVSGGCPILAILEDVHWADPSTVALLGMLTQRLEGKRLLLVLSARPEFQPPWPQPASLERLVLGRLSPEMSATLVKEVARGQPLSTEAVEALVARTDGVPLFMEEMVRRVIALAPRSGAPVEKPPIPITLHELLLARLDALPSRQRALAQRCAVVGRDFSTTLLSYLWDQEEGSLETELAGLLASGLLQQQEEATGYQFRHVLFQEAAYLSLTRSLRRQYHARTAQALAEHFPEVAEERPEVLAHHHTQAGAPSPAIRWWVRAGELAERRSADPEAVGHFTQALKLLRELPDEAERNRHELLIQLMLGLSRMRTQGFRAPEVERAYARAEELLLTGQEGTFRLGLLTWGISSYYFGRAEFDRMLRLAEAMVSRGRSTRDPAILVEGHRMMATALLMRGELVAASEQIQRAVAFSRFRPDQHPALLLEYGIDPAVAALVIGSGIHALLGRLSEARRQTREALRLGRRLGDPRTTAFALTYTALHCVHIRDPECALKRADEAITLCREHHFDAWLLVSLFTRGWALAELGLTREGEDLMRQAIGHWKKAGWWAHLPGAVARLAELHLRQGQSEEGFLALREAQEWTRKTGVHMEDSIHARLHGELLRQIGQEDQARSQLLRALIIARRQHHRLAELRAASSLARQLRDQDQRQRAWRLLERRCNGFTPHREPTDLREARALLSELALTHAPGAPVAPPGS
ncbi:protein kinase domain-containing protein [Hyalangium versicolor]|uniref:protein kinase domain-containing protein n=1 Tax=Hyalangium versicolor TaxID=2861190 RepID=UPI001CC9CC92|nr:protein kinase [Hyalangium versicolor]